MKIDCYKNIRKRCYSIRSREPNNYGKVVDHKLSAYIEDAKFVVQPAGRDAVRHTGVKNVHAFIRGKKKNSIETNGYPTPIFYNPLAHQGFIDDRGRLVKSADLVELSPGHVYAYGVKYKDGHN